MIGKLSSATRQQAAVVSGKYEGGSLLRGAALLFVVTLMFQLLFFYRWGVQFSSALQLSYALIILALLLGVDGLLQSSLLKTLGFGWPEAGKASGSVLCGVLLTLATAPLSFLSPFEISYIGFPLPFKETVGIIGGGSTPLDPVLLLTDIAYWTCLIAPILWLLTDGGKVKRDWLEGAGVGAFLTFGVFPFGVLFLGAIGAYGWGGFGQFSPFIWITLPGVLVGSAAAVAGRRAFGGSVAFSSLLLVLMVGLSSVAPSYP